jgi:hypothetical protein
MTKHEEDFVHSDAKKKQHPDSKYSQKRNGMEHRDRILWWNSNSSKPKDDTVNVCLRTYQQFQEQQLRIMLVNFNTGAKQIHEKKLMKCQIQFKESFRVFHCRHYERI